MRGERTDGSQIVFVHGVTAKELLNAAGLESLRALIDSKLDSASFETDQSGRFFRIPSRPLKSTTITREITTAVSEWACTYKYRCAFEVALPGIERNNNKGAVIDVVLENDEDNSAPIAIEIDRGNKTWSIRKLMHAVSQGYVALWIKWGLPVSSDIPAEIAVINIPLQFMSWEDRTTRLDYEAPDSS